MKDCGKCYYKTKKDAETMLNFRLKHKRGKRHLMIYQCLDCKLWHLTSHFGRGVAKNIKLDELYFVKRKWTRYN